MFQRIALLSPLLALAFLLYSPSAQAQCTQLDQDGDGFLSIACGGADCDDLDALINPIATEVVADGIDSNCDGLELCYADLDADGWGDSNNLVLSSNLSCAGPGIAAVGGDCDDTSQNTHPGAVDIPNNGIDEDCNGYDETAVPTSNGNWGMLKRRY